MIFSLQPLNPFIVKLNESLRFWPILLLASFVTYKLQPLIHPGTLRKIIRVDGSGKGVLTCINGGGGMGFGIVTKKCKNCGCVFRCMDDVRIIYCRDCYLEVCEPDDCLEGFPDS